MEIKKPIIVSGAHRSGSTWVGQVLSACNGVGYLHEPFNPIYANPRDVPIDHWYLKVDETNEDIYRQHFQNVMDWKFKPFSRWSNVNSFARFKLWLKYWKVFEANKRKGSRVLMKDPIALFSLPWLDRTFDANTLVLVRHPAAFFYSLKRKNWAFPFQDLVAQDPLMKGELRHYEKEIRAFALHPQDMIDQAILVWRLLYGTVSQYRELYAHWLIKTHEEISMAPLVHFEQIFGQFGLPFDDQVKEFIAATSGNENPGETIAGEELLKRNSKANSQYWKRKLSADQIAYIKEETADVWPKFYNEEDW